MDKTIKEQLDKMEDRLNDAWDNDLFYDPEYERSVMFPNGEDEEEDDFAF
ncbi:hypothetical protein [Leyella stercorea]